MEHPGDEGGEGKVAVAAAFAVQEAFETELAAKTEEGGDMTMGKGAADGEGIVEGAIDLAPLEQGADAVDDLRGELGEVGEGGASDALALAFGVAEEDGGWAVAVGDDIDVVGHGAVASYMETIMITDTPTIQGNTDIISEFLHGNKYPVGGSG